MSSPTTTAEPGRAPGGADPRRWVALAVVLMIVALLLSTLMYTLSAQSDQRAREQTQRTLEHFHFWGCVEEVRSQRLLPPEVPASGIVAYRSLMNEHWHSFEGREIVGQYYFQKNDRMPQYRFSGYIFRLRKQGAIAQLGERLNGIQEVVGSIPIGSTKLD